MWPYLNIPRRAENNRLSMRHSRSAQSLCQLKKKIPPGGRKKDGVVFAPKLSGRNGREKVLSNKIGMKPIRLRITFLFRVVSQIDDRVFSSGSMKMGFEFCVCVCVRFRK